MYTNIPNVAFRESGKTKHSLCKLKPMGCYNYCTCNYYFVCTTAVFTICLCIWLQKLFKLMHYNRWCIFTSGWHLAGLIKHADSVSQSEPETRRTMSCHESDQSKQHPLDSISTVYALPMSVQPDVKPRIFCLSQLAQSVISCRTIE